MEPQFVHLNLHTEYALIDSVVRVKGLPEAVVSKNMPAVAITDPCNLFAMVKFYREAIAAGVKPIIGVELFIENKKKHEQPYRLILLCQNKIGYKNLTNLISRAYTDGNRVEDLPTVKKSWLTNHTEGLIALSGGICGDIGRALLANKNKQARQLSEFWQELFPKRFYLELARTGRHEEEYYIHSAIELAEEHNLPVVATNDVRFIAGSDFEAHEARVCIYKSLVLNDESRARLYTEQQYLRTPEEMTALFSDIPEAISNTVEIAKRCNLQLSLGEVFLPNFPVPENVTIEQYLENQAHSGLLECLEQDFETVTDEIRKQYEERLETELNVINRMGYAGYFLIVADFILWAKHNGIPVGPGRGSGAGSLVAYALKITNIDPLKYDLLFERFLNSERVSMPDFDIDFCMEGRDRVIEYVTEQYGRKSVSQIITYGTMAARAVVRDVGRVLGHPYGYVDKLAKLIPFEIGMTLKKALQQEEQLLEKFQDDDEVRTLITLAMKLEGLPRNAGKHAGGVVIAPSELTDFMPLYCEEKGGQLLTQFDKDDVETLGLVKFDFLGLRTLTIINWALQTINAKRKTPIDIDHIPMDDEKTFKLLKNCNTTAVFQLESRGMKDLVKRLKPDCFEDILALVALFRPGPLQSGMVDDFIDRKHGRACVEYPHPQLERILRPTYGVILYQEQVMQIAQILAGYTLGGADLLRRAMGKKKPEEMAKHRALFVDGAQKNDVDPHLANQIFDLMEKFAGYGFNKSHSAAYALLSYQTAWLKTHYPAEFMSAVLSSDMDHTDKVVRFIYDCEQLKIPIIPPDINQSYYKFTVNESEEIVYGLGAIKGVGSAAIDAILSERKNNGRFSDLFEFCQRIDTRKANRKVLEALIRSGAFDSFGSHRAALFAAIDDALQAAEQHSRNEEVGQHDLFGGELTEKMAENPMKPYQHVQEWNDEERLQGEYDTLGIYITGHPIEQYEKELLKFIGSPIQQLKPNKDQMIMVAGFISAIRSMISKKGNKMAFINLADRTARIEIAVFSDIYEEYRDILIKGHLLVIEGEVSSDDFTGGLRMRARKIYTLDQARASFAKCLIINLEKRSVDNELVACLTQALIPYKGGNCPIQILYQKNNANAQLQLGKNWAIYPRQELLNTLNQEYGQEAVALEY